MFTRLVAHWVSFILLYCIRQPPAPSPNPNPKSLVSLVSFSIPKYRIVSYRIVTLRYREPQIAMLYRKSIKRKKCVKSQKKTKKKKTTIVLPSVSSAHSLPSLPFPPSRYTTLTRTHAHTSYRKQTHNNKGRKMVVVAIVVGLNRARASKASKKKQKM